MLEAMREGVPVLASNIPPHRNHSWGTRDPHAVLLLTGHAFQAGDVDSCVRTLDWAIHHPAELATMARSAQRYVQANHSWDHITTETLRLYKTLSTSPNIFSRFNFQTRQLRLREAEL